ncbi:lipoate--protein ligase A [Desulfurococcaceae archaeon AG1]|jgi:lipoate-protein ligase A|nr:lipoate--protein ligase A [Desulfurococcaceae archaeon AG1]
MVEGGSPLRIGIYEHKAPKGLIRVTVKVVDGVIEDIRIAGDFFIYPEDFVYELEQKLRGLKAEPAAIGRVVEDLFRSEHVESVGSSVDDFKTAIVSAVKEAGEVC